MSRATDARGVLLAVALLAVTLFSGCTSLNECEPERGLSPLRRAGKDLVVLASSPVTLLTKPFQETGYTFDDGQAGYFVAAPLTFTFSVARNAYWTLFHTLDLVFYPFYSYSRATPLEIYDIHAFPYQYLTPETYNDEHVYPPSDLIIPFYFLTLGTGYFLDPYAWKFADGWPAIGL